MVVYHFLVAMLLIMKKLNEEQIDKELELGEKFLEKIKEDLEIFEEQDNNKEDNENNLITPNLKEKIQELLTKENKLFQKKNELIIEAIGQMYKGVLIENELSVNKGKIYHYKHHSTYGISTKVVKEKIQRNLHEVVEKISKKNKNNVDILEFLLNLVEENEFNTYQRIEFKLPQTYVFISLKSEGIEWDKVIKINIKINANDISVEFEKGNERSVYITEYQEHLLLLKFEKELTELLYDFKTNLINKNETLEAEIEQIKEKASHLLILSTLNRDNEEMK